MATFPLINQFDHGHPIGSVEILDSIAYELAANAEFVELIPMIDLDGNIVCFSLMFAPAEALDET
jgi:hypothetical protein